MEPATPPREPPILNITGGKVLLGPLRRDLTPLVQQWFNDFEAAAMNGSPLTPVTQEAEEARYKQVSRSEDVVAFTVYQRATLRPIGVCGLQKINHAHRTAEFLIYIGAKDCWGQGYGTETTRLTLDYGFTALGLHSIWLTVFSFNKRGIRAYKRAGFREAGRLREAHRLGGQAYDVLYMDCLATEFQSPVLRRLLAPASDGEPAP
jgi:diamine N-acetyltransferase